MCYIVHIYVFFLFFLSQSLDFLFFSVIILNVICWLLWMASIDGRLPPLAARHFSYCCVTGWCTYLVNKISLSLSQSLYHNQYTLYLRWSSGVAVGSWDLRSIGRGFNYHRTKLRSNLGQFVHTYVPLSPSSITWYWSKDGEVLRLGRWPQAWQK